MKHRFEAKEALEDYDRDLACRSIRSILRAERRPRMHRPRNPWMRVLLPFGLAFKGRTHGFEGRLVGGIEDVLQRPASGAISFTNHLQHLDGGDQRGGGEVLERAIVGDVDGLDIETLGLQPPKADLARSVATQRANPNPALAHRDQTVQKEAPPFSRRRSPNRPRLWSIFRPPMLCHRQGFRDRAAPQGGSDGKMCAYSRVRPGHECVRETARSARWKSVREGVVTS